MIRFYRPGMTLHQGLTLAREPTGPRWALLAVGSFRLRLWCSGSRGISLWIYRGPWHSPRWSRVVVLAWGLGTDPFTEPEESGREPLA